jgi:hypothetical protein
VARKQHVEKERKAVGKRKSNVACRQGILTMIGLGFLKNIVMNIIHKVV